MIFATECCLLCFICKSNIMKHLCVVVFFLLFFFSVCVFFILFVLLFLDHAVVVKKSKGSNLYDWNLAGSVREVTRIDCRKLPKTTELSRCPSFGELRQYFDVTGIFPRRLRVDESSQRNEHRYPITFPLSPRYRLPVPLCF